MYRYGKFIGFKNTPAGDKGLDIYLGWIKEESDFEHERKNIKNYSSFADSVNGNIIGAKKIVVPKVHEELSTSNIIVMDYVEDKTINQLELNEENKEKIAKALNSYFQLSFYALLNNKSVIFHGDPHGGNIYLDKDGNIGFLDMGLTYELSDEDYDMTKKFFLAIYSRNPKQVYDLLMSMEGSLAADQEKLKHDINEYCKNIKDKPVTSWFMDMIGVCLNQEIVPPKFLFNMAKAFACLSGINGFSDNLISATELLKEQATDYYIKRSINDISSLAVSGVKLVPKLLNNLLENGLVKGTEMQTTDTSYFYRDAKETLNNCKEFWELFISPEEGIETDKGYSYTRKCKY